MNAVLNENHMNEAVEFQPNVLEVKPADKISIIEDTLAQMQSKITAIKQAKQTQKENSAIIQELTLKLAEAQAKETKIAEELLELEIEWQELTKKLNVFSDISNDSGNQSSQ
jgi:chromosome segregation ATPase